MSIRVKILQIISTVFLVLTSTVGFANAQAGVGLIADEISFDPKTQLLTATGNVRVLYNDQVLNSQTVIYNQSTGQLTLPQPFELVGADGTVIAGSSASLDQTATSALITGAQILINDQFQLAASDFERKDDRYKVMSNVVASTCYICASDDIPFWQIRSKRVIHDEQEKRIYFENPVLRLLGFPVLYLPYLSTPDPTVERASGVLIPTFRQSNLLGYRIGLPYYFALTDHSDATLTPTVSTKESFVLEGQYRQRYASGYLEFNGAVALADPLTTKNFRSFIEADAEFNLPNDFQLDVELNLSADKDFKNDYGFSDEDRLENFISFERTRRTSYFSVGSSFTQSLRTNEVDQEIPLVLPEAYFRKNLYPVGVPGQITLEAQTATLFREDGSQIGRFGGGVHWKRSFNTETGLLFGLSTGVDANTYWLADNPAYAQSSYSEVLPTASIDVRYPLARVVGAATHVIEPIAQLVWSSDKLSTTPNEDSPQAEFEESNLFSTDRFQGFDDSERGLRANIGVTYLRYDPDGWELGITAGRVFRQKDLGQFPSTVSAGLAGSVSDYVAAISLRFPNEFRLNSRMLFDGKFNVSKNETQLGFTYQKLDIEASYVWLDQGSILSNNTRQNELSLETAYQHDQNWLLTADWRHDLEGNEPIEAEFGAEYQNECAKVAFSVSLQNDGFGKLDREFGLNISLEGLGTRKNKPKFARRCGL